MKKLIVLFIVLFSLVFASSALLSVEATSGEVSVKITAIFDNGNEIKTPFNRPYGTTITHTDALAGLPTSGYEFVFWVVNGVVDTELAEATTFTVTSRLELQAVYKPTGEYVVVFVDANGVYLGSKYTEGSAVNATGINLPGKPNYTENGWLNIHGGMTLGSPITADSVFMLQYTPDGTLPKVNISVTDGTSIGEVDFNTVVTINPNPADSGLEFSHWTENGVIVSYNAEYKFTALTHRSLSAVYVATGTVSEVPVVTLSKDLELRDGYHTYTGQLYLPAGLELVEYGFLFSNSAVMLEYSSAPVKAQSSSLNETTNEFITSFKMGSHMAMRAYMIYFNGVSNEIEISDVNHRYIDEFLYNFNFASGHGTTYSDPEASVNFVNIVDSSAFPVTLYRVAANTTTISGETTSRSLVLSPRLGDANTGISYAIFDFQDKLMDKLSFDTYFWNSSAEQYFTKYELQVWNNDTNDWEIHTDLLDIIQGTLVVNKVSIYNIGSSLMRFYAEGGQNGGNTARLNLDNLIASDLYKDEVHDIVFNNEGSITNQLVANSKTATSFTPSKTGYTFNGWYTTDTFIEPTYNFSTPVTADLILYAKYTVNQYTITFDSNGGSSVTPITQNYDTEVSKPSNPTRSGYTFDDWYTDDNTFLSKYVFSTMIENITIHAKWNLINYDITYNGLSGASNSNPTTYNIETPTINLADPGLRDGFTFVGWFDLEEDGNEVESILLGSTGDKILYARWDEVAAGQVLVSYEAYDGEPAPSATYVNVDETFTAPTEPTKTGYTFEGWYTSDSFVTEWDFDVNTTDVAMTLYAKWELITYNINYLGLDGESNSNPLSYNIETPTITLENPGTRTGFIFLGWFTASSGGSKVENIVLGSTGDKNFHAQWRAVSTLMIYEVYGGGGNSGATYTHDYVILYNGTSGTINLSGYSIQYASATGDSWAKLNLTKSVASGSYYVIQLAGGSVGSPLPKTPHDIGTINMSATAGKVALVSSTTSLTGANPISDPTIVDFVGFGTTAGAYEGTGRAPAPSNTNSIKRNSFVDTNNNNTDFTAVPANLTYLNP
ncbi:MAG: InlB B-repeat-containing protein [Acholeplasmataceae bacterium]|nr:InlB B-repeat-containing protein [Acholeplasmataceae bacterium]